MLAGWGYTPVAVEVRDEAEPLDTFLHPDDAVYVFGPEDGSLRRGILTSCHRFLRIPTAVRTPLNLAAAVNIVLYDRHVKRLHASPPLAAVELESAR
jgi:tRNA(Leu) C34 or U34 (ribose-2'-O)-methylase TrmL